MNPGQYAKAIVAVIGAGVTTLLGLVPPESLLWIILTVVAAMVTAVGVFMVPNATPAQPAGAHEAPGL